MSPIINPSVIAKSADTKNSDQLNGRANAAMAVLFLKNAAGSPIEGDAATDRPAAARDSPICQANFVDNTLTDQSSILRFIEDNGARPHRRGLLRRNRREL